MYKENFKYMVSNYLSVLEVEAVEGDCEYDDTPQYFQPLREIKVLTEYGSTDNNEIFYEPANPRGWPRLQIIGERVIRHTDDGGDWSISSED